MRKIRKSVFSNPVNITIVAVSLAIGLFVATLSIPSCRRDSKIAASLPEDALRELNAVIDSADWYRTQKQHDINQVRRRLDDAKGISQRWQISFELSNTYRQINTDSALVYARRCQSLARESQDSVKVRLSHLLLSRALATAGLFVDAFDQFRAVSPASISNSTEAITYWTTGRLVYGYAHGYVQGLDPYAEKYKRQYVVCDDSLLRCLPDNDFRRFIESERLVTTGNYTAAREKLQHILNSVHEDTNIYGMAAYQMALVCRYTGDEEAYAQWLCEAAISDIKGCVREGIALPNLAEWLYNRGELSNAFGYINFSLEEAQRGNARMRTVNIAKMVPMIDEAYRNEIDSKHDELMIYFLLAATMCLISVALVIVLVRQIHKSREKSDKLRVLSRLQDNYIGNFIEMCSAYADRLDSLTRTVSRKLSQGQSEELLKLINSGKFADAQYDSFYAIFDSAFLDLYPDFIDGFNKLLRPEERIVVKDERTLTPELRIYALVRLGVEESTKIAGVLHYSVNTVYAYRNRMRNRALARDTFEADVQLIEN